MMERAIQLAAYAWARFLLSPLMRGPRDIEVIKAEYARKWQKLIPDIGGVHSPSKKLLALSRAREVECVRENQEIGRGERWMMSTRSSVLPR